MKKLMMMIFTAVLCLSFIPVNVHAEEETYMTVTSYTETFKPNGTDGELTTTVKATAGSDGYIYLIKTLSDVEVLSVTGENITAELEEYALGSVVFYRAKVTDPSAEATVTAVMKCTGFYKDNFVADTNGGNTNSLSYTFKNYFNTAIGKYALTIYTPEGNEIVKVTTPNKYANFTLGEDECMLTIGVSGKVAVNGSSAIAFTYNPNTTGMTKALVWVICLAIGAFVFIDRYKKATK